MINKALSFISIIFLVFPLSGFSHHSFVSQFDPNQEVVLSGTVARVRWTNPHAFFDVVVTTENGEEELWAFELGSPNTLIRYGWYRDTLQEGDAITVDGYLARSGANLANAKIVTLADGTVIQAGSSYLEETE
ncbi:MAG: DUF6152 family protein [Gammaproteobacteria bacterium]|nr:DUF6152 family protein [Gammaproteobacteria bacterium]